MRALWAAALALGLLAPGAAYAERGCTPLNPDEFPLRQVDRRALERDTARAQAAFAELNTFAETATPWRDEVPAAPENTELAIELHVVGSFGNAATSVLAWRGRDGRWTYARADVDFTAPPPPPPPPPPPDWPEDQEWAPAPYPDMRYSERRGVIAPETAARLEALLADACRAREPTITPYFFAVRRGALQMCHDGPLYRMIVRREDEVLERIAQTCQARWRNGRLLTLIDNLGGGA